MARMVGLALALGLALAGAGQAAGAERPIEIVDPWSRATPPSARTGVIYLGLRNNGSEADRLVGVAADVAQRLELHEASMADGVMRMRPVEAIDLPAGGETRLEPGGFHIMLVELHRPLVEGESIALRLELENAGNLAVEVPILGLGSRGPAPGAHGHDG
jgi:periplasmic copper chaperone A